MSDTEEEAARRTAFGDWNRDKLESQRLREEALAEAEALEEQEEADDGITRWRPVLRLPITAPGLVARGFSLYRRMSLDGAGKLLCRSPMEKRHAGGNLTHPKPVSQETTQKFTYEARDVVEALGIPSPKYVSLDVNATDQLLITLTPYNGPVPKPSIEVVGRDSMMDRLFGPGASAGASFKPISDYAMHPETEVPPPHPRFKDLQPSFWEHIKAGNKIRAIKELRDATGLSLLSSKKLLDYIIPSGFLRFTAEDAPARTVIRIRGSLEEGQRRGFVFEKTDDGTWEATGDTYDYASASVQRSIDCYGFDLIYSPK